MAGSSGQTEVDPEAKKPKKPEEVKSKLAPKVQSAVYANQRISSSLDISHMVNLQLIGMWALSFPLAFCFLLRPRCCIPDRDLCLPHLVRPTEY